MLDPILHLVNGDGQKQPPQVTALLKHIASLPGRREEAAIDGLNHVFRIDAQRQLTGQPPVGEGDELLGIALVQFLGRLRVAFLPASDEVDRRIFHADTVLAGRKEP